VRGLEVGEVVRVRGDLAGGMPTAFTWRGTWHEVRRWRDANSRRRIPAGRRWEVRTAAGMTCVLVRDSSSQGWRLERVLDTQGGGA
jgi:hypothetical protein